MILLKTGNFRAGESANLKIKLWPKVLKLEKNWLSPFSNPVEVCVVAGGGTWGRCLNIWSNMK